MANPLAVFRRYEKTLLAIFGVALMVAFLVQGVVTRYSGTGGAGAENRVVVQINSENLRESDLQNLLVARHHVRNFMRGINQLASEKGATPQQGLGVPDTDAEEDLVQTAILARQAEGMGIVVTDQSIIDFLTRYSQNKLGKGDFAYVLQTITQGRMSQTQFMDAMRRELLAQRYLTVMQRGMYPPTPAGAWDYFLRLNRRISFQAVPYPVQDYLGRVAEPSDGQIEALFHEGKNRYPLPGQPETGFKRLKQVAIQYVKGDITTFLTDAKAAISDDQVVAYYEAHKEEFRNLELPTFDESTAPKLDDPLKPDESGVPQPGQESSPQGAAPAAPSDGAPSEPAAPPSDPLLPDATPPQDVPPDSGAHLGATSTLLVQAAEEPVEEGPAPPDSEAEGLAELQEDQPTAGNDPQPDPQPDVATAGDESAEAQVPADDAPSDAVPADAAAPAAAAEQPADPLDELPALQQPEDPLAGLPEAAGNNAPGARPEFKPLEEVADDIRARLAMPVAQQKMEQALNVLRGKMRAYFSSYLAWDVSGERDTTTQPDPPDLRPLAEQQGLTYGSVPLVNEFQLQQTDPVTGDALYEISGAYDTNFVPFVQHVFAEDLRPYEVRSIRGQVLDTEYLYWKTDEVAERVPELSDVREEVVRALKMKQALDLARQDAQTQAAQLNQSGQVPRVAFANDPNRKVIEAQSVSWMTRSNVPYLPPRLSRIAGIEYAGDDFMRSIFSLPVGQSGVAVDNPRNVVYVVTVTSVDSDEQQLRAQFMLPTSLNETTLLAQSDSQRQLQTWYAALEKQLGVDWQRPPRRDSRLR